MPTSKSKWFNFFIFQGGGRYLFSIALCLIFSAFLGALLPLKITQLAQNYNDTTLFSSCLKTLCILFIGIYFNQVLYQLAVNRYILLLMQNVRLRCYQKWLHVYDIQSGRDKYSERYPLGEIIARMINDTESLRELMTSRTFGIFIDFFFILSCLGSFLFLNQKMGLFLTVAEMLAIALLIWGSRYMRKIFLEVRKSRAFMSRTIADLGGGFKQTYYTQHEGYARQRGFRAFNDYLVKILHSNIWDASYYSLAESLYPIFLALVILIAPYSGITQVAIVFAIVDLIQRSINPIKEASAKLANIQRAYTGIGRVQEFLDDLKDLPSSEKFLSQNHSHFQSLSLSIKKFSYSQPDSQNENSLSRNFSLKDIQFKAKKGELLGIVGLSGCGKSTLLNIMAANIIPTEGTLKLSQNEKQITFPGDSVENIVHYRQHVSLISQESHLFSASLAFNISLTNEAQPALQEFWNWVKDQIPYLKNWGIELESPLNPNDLSLGQGQLLAAVRSCYLKKTIILFDEISSSLDSELEEALRKMVLILQKNSLTIIVAHRLETIMKADHILVMDDGQIKSSGKHRELKEKCSTYRQFLEELSLSH